MTPNQFRKLALALPGTTEGAHGGHPDFRAGAGGKVFASLGAPDAAHGMVKLTPDQQALLVATNATVFVPVRGAWGEKGYTSVRLTAADANSIKHALALAHQNCAPNIARRVVPKKLMAGLEARPSKTSSKTSKR
jgi:hypothetical protein